MKLLRPCVFLDRDGVLNAPVEQDGQERPPWSLEELQIYEYSKAACDLLREIYLLVVVTNQPDVARGKLKVADAQQINSKISQSLELDGLYACFDSGTENCDCRKPKPGMVFQAAEELGIDLSKSWLVGDRWVDIATAKNAGVKPTVLVKRPLSWEPTHQGSPPPDLKADFEVANLMEAAQLIRGLI